MIRILSTLAVILFWIVSPILAVLGVITFVLVVLGITSSIVYNITHDYLRNKHL
jgi:hypothetical protein